MHIHIFNSNETGLFEGSFSWVVRGLLLLLLVFTQDIHFSVLKNIAISMYPAKNQSEK